MICTEPGVCTKCGAEGCTNTPDHYFLRWERNPTQHWWVCQRAGCDYVFRGDHFLYCDSNKCQVCNHLNSPNPRVHREEITLAGSAATCTASGLTQGKYCNTCQTTTVPQEVIPSPGHSEIPLQGYGATCTTSGLTDGKHCVRCNVDTVPQEVIPSTGHTEIILPGREATADDAGLTEGKQCTVCNTVTVKQEIIPATGHDEMILPGKEATCTEPGLTEGRQCKDCNKVTLPQEVIPLLGHNEVPLPVKAVTCTEPGFTEGKHCIRCGVDTVPQEVIPASGHTEFVLPAVAPTDADDGLTEGRQCSVCGTVTVPQVIIPATGHDYWGEWTPRDTHNHVRYCHHDCGHNVTVGCEDLTVLLGEDLLAVCPVCGRFGQEILPLLAKAEIIDAIDSSSDTPVIRAQRNPHPQHPECLAIITAIYEQNGLILQIALDTRHVTVKLPLLTEDSCRLVFVSFDEETQQHVWTTVPFSIEDGYMVFTTNQLGLFLLIAE